MRYVRSRAGVVAALMAAVCAAPVVAWAQPEKAPGDTAPDTALAERLEELCAKVQTRLDRYHIPGAALAVVKDDRVILARGFGLRDVERKTPVGADSLFAIGSTSKAFTSLLCAMLVDEGKLKWDEPVTGYLPGFTLKDETAAREATLRDLLSHRTGLSRTDMVWAGGGATREQILRQIGNAQLKDPFRTKFNYNNVMFLAAGTAAGHAAGSDWDTLVKTRIFEPLGMTSSTTRIEEMTPDPRASKGYRWDDEKKSYTFLPMRNLKGIAPAGAINSNVIDMSKWVRLQLGRGTFEGKKLVSPEQVEATWEKQIDMAPTIGYALGWMVHEWDGKRVVEHGGNIDGFAAEVAMLPDQRVGLVLLANVSATPLQSEIQSLVWETVFPPEKQDAGALGATELNEYVGKYRFEMMGVDCTALTRDGKLCVDVPGQTVYELKWPDAEGKWAFAVTDAIKVRFERDAASAVVAMTMFQSGMEFRLPKAGAGGAEEKAPMGLEELRWYTGKYTFPLTNEEWPVIVKNGRLVLDVPGQMPYVLEWPNQKGRWVFQVKKDLEVEFAKGDDGKVGSLTLFQAGQTFVMPRVAGSDAPALPSVDELMKKRQTAGGGGAVAMLGNVRVTGKVDFVHQGIDGRVSLLFSGTDRFVQELDFSPFGFIRAASDGASV